jgi:transposase
VREWKRSGLTAADYAAREGLNARTLSWWSSELGRSLAMTRPPMVEVLVARPPANALELILPSGMKVAVPVGFDEATLGRLLTVLEAR